jgi:hypothetical protein
MVPPAAAPCHLPAGLAFRRELRCRR